MAHEVDGQGNVKVYNFTIHYTDTEEIDDECDDYRTCDYTDGWNHMRQLGADWEGIDKINTYTIDWDYEWIPAADVESYIAEVNGDDDD